MKILFYNHTAQVSGAERVLGMILARLDRDHFTPVVLCPEGAMMEMASSLGVPGECVGQLNARFTWRLDHLFRYVTCLVRVIREVRMRVIKLQPNIIHANSIRAGLVMAFATSGLDVPVIWHAHDILPSHPLSTAIRFIAGVSRRNFILAVSHAVAGRFRGSMLRWFGRRVPVTVIHNAVDTESFQPDPETRREIRQALGLTEGQPVVGIVGHLTPNKGQLELIEAFASMSLEIADAVLLVVGEPLFNRSADYAKSLARAADSCAVADRVRLLGPRDDVPALMQSFDLLVLNSRIEAFPLTILEGLASGTPVLATAVGGIPEMIRHKENGWLVPARDRLALTNAMANLLRQPELRRQLGRNARRDAVARYSIESYLSEVESLYRQIKLRSSVTYASGGLEEQLATD